MEDISQLSPLVVSTPEEAAKNISLGKATGTDPSVVQQNPDIYTPIQKRLDQPTMADPQVADYSKQSPEHAALAAPDIENLSWMARASRFFKDYAVDRPSMDQEIVKLNLKKMDQNGSLHDDDFDRLMYLNSNRAEVVQRNYGLFGPIPGQPETVKKSTDIGDQVGLGDDLNEEISKRYGGAFEKAAGWAIESGSDLVQSIGRGLITAGGMPGRHLPFMAQAAKVAFGVGKDIYDTTRGGVYNELPETIDPTVRKYAANGTGAVAAALQMATLGVGAETAPFLKPFINPSAMAAKIMAGDAASVALRETLVHLGQNVVMQSAVQGTTHITKVLAENIAKTWDGTEQGFYNGLAAAGKEIPTAETAKQFGLGAAQALLFAGPPALLGFGVMKNRYEFSHDVMTEIANSKEFKGVTSDPGVPPTTPSAVSEWSTHVKTLQLHELLHQINEVQGATKMSELAPEQLNEINKQIISSNLKKVWIDAKNADKYAKLFDPDKLLPSKQNAPVGLDPHDLLAAARKDPSIIDHTKLEADGPSPVNSAEYFDKVRQADEARMQILAKMNVKNPPPTGAKATNLFELPQKAGEEKFNSDAAIQRIKQIDGLVKEHQAYLDKASEHPSNVIDINPKARLNREMQLKDTKHAMDRLQAESEGLQAKIDKEPVEFSNEDRAKWMEHRQYLQSFVDSGLLSPEEKASATNDIAMLDKELTPKEADNLLKADFVQHPKFQSADQYVNQPSISDAIKRLFQDKGADRLIEAQKRTRQRVVEGLSELAAKQMDKIADQNLEVAKQNQMNKEMERIDNDPTYAPIDKFHREVVANEKGKKPVSVYAIDPETLPDELLPYTEHYMVKEHGVFKKGGISADDSAQLLGYESLAEMLKAFASNPPREKIIEARSRAYDAQLRMDTGSNVRLEDTDFIKNLNDKTKIHIEEMDLMKSKEWGATKGSIKMIALKTPSFEEITQEAHDNVQQMKVGDLDLKQFVAGEHESNKAALDHLLNNRVEEAFNAKRQAAVNSAMQKEVAIANGEINRVQTTARWYTSPIGKNTIERAGGILEKTSDELLGYFNLNPSKQKVRSLESYQKWLKESKSEGLGDFEIPQRFQDYRQSIDDMTVEQTKAVGDLLSVIRNQARLKGKLYGSLSQKVKAAENSSADAQAVSGVAWLQEHPDWNENKIQPPNGAPTITNVQAKIQGKAIWVQNMAAVLNKLDREQVGGWMWKNIGEPLFGSGDYNEKAGVSGKKADALRWKAWNDKAVSDFDYAVDQANTNKMSFRRTHYNDLGGDVRFIPEFEKSEALGNGRLSVKSLMVLWAHGGDPDGYVNRAKMGVSNETIQTVLDRELDEHHVKLAQSMLPDFKETLKDRVGKLQSEFTGEQPGFIEARPNKWKDQTFRGGYIRQLRMMDFDAKAMEADLQRAGTAGGMFAEQYASERTSRNFWKERTDSDLALDLNWDKHLRTNEEVIHDLNFREVGYNTMKLLNNSSFKKAIMSAGTKADYDLLVSGTRELVGEMTAKNYNFFGDASEGLNRIARASQSATTIAQLGLNIKTMLVHLSQLPMVAQMAGVGTFSKHFASTVGAMLRNPHMLGEFYNGAKELDHTVGNFASDVNNLDAISRQAYSRDPVFARAKGQDGILPVALDALPKLRDAIEKNVTHYSMAGLGFMDTNIKVMALNALKSQFLAGDAHIPLSELQKMTPEEVQSNMQSYVHQVSKSVLSQFDISDKAPMQKLFPGWSLYWNILRQNINRMMSMYRSTKWAVKGINDSIGSAGGGAGGNVTQGDFGTNIQSATSGLAKTGAAAMGSITSLVMAKMVEDWARGHDGPLNQKWDFSTKQGQKQAGHYMLNYLNRSTIEKFPEELPIAGEVMYAAYEKPTKGSIRDVTIPQIQLLTHIATAMRATTDYFVHGRTPDYLQQQSIENTVGAYFGGVPRQALKAVDSLEKTYKNQKIRSGYTQPATEDLQKGIKGWFDEHAKNDFKGVDPGVKDEAQKLQDSLKGDTSKVPDGMQDKIRYAESGDKYQPQKGYYNFTPDRWQEIQKRAPQLGLTGNGRTSQESGEQEKAMDWSLHDNARRLAEKGIPVNDQTMYGAHKFGVEDYEKIFQAPGNTKLKNLLPGITEKNPDLENFKTVGQVKSYLLSILSQGKTAKLTEPTNKAED